MNDNSNAPHCQDSTKGDAQRTENSTQTGTGTALPQEKRKINDCHEYACHHATRAKWWHRIDWSQVILDALLLIVGVKLACIYTGQLNQMIRSNTLLDKSIRLDERAWLSVEVTSSPALAGRPLRDIGIFANTGKTYALNVRACKVVDETRNDPPINPIKEPPTFYDCSKESDWHSHGVLAPNSRVQVDFGSAYVAIKGVGYPITKQIADYYNAGKRVTWRYGEVRYDDIFGCHHWVRYCYDRAPTSDGSPSKFVTCNDPERSAIDSNGQ